MLFTSNTIDQPGKQIATALHGGWQAGAQDFTTADTWLIVGQNPLISKSAGVPSQNPGRRLTEAVARGLRLVVIDPRRSETARRAHVHLQPRPGEDPALLAGMLHVIFDEGREDAAFLADNAQGVDALREAVRAFTPDAVARRADVPERDLVAAARVFAGARRGGAVCGTGPSFATHGTLTEYLALVSHDGVRLLAARRRRRHAAQRAAARLHAEGAALCAVSGLGLRREAARARPAQHRGGSAHGGASRRDPARGRGPRARALLSRRQPDAGVSGPAPDARRRCAGSTCSSRSIPSSPRRRASRTT